MSVTWNATTQTLSYNIDGGQQEGTLPSTIATQFLGDSNFAYFGFGAGTGGLSNTQSVRNISVTATFEGQTPGNPPPVANPDTATTAAGAPVNIFVLNNDSDPNGDPLTITAVLNGLNGTTTINNNGTPAPGDDFVIYTPNAGFSGSDSFTYTISDGTTARSAAVNVTVTPPPGNPPPVANPDTATTAAGAPANIFVLDNDSDPNGDPLTITAVLNGLNGTTTINNNGTPAPGDDFVIYTPNAGFSGSDSFTYTISDGTTARSAAVNVTVTPPTGAVTLTPHGSASVNAATTSSP